jgi:hypothetical protein
MSFAGDSYDPLEFDLRRTGYLRGPDHRKPDHINQMADYDEQSVSRMMQIMLAQKNAAAAPAEKPAEKAASDKSSFRGSLRGPDHRTLQPQ